MINDSLNWYVLFVQTTQEDTLCGILNRCKEVHAICPKYEHYRKDRNIVENKSLFSGYVFVKTYMGQLDFNDWLKSLENKKGFIKQLQYKQTPALREEEIYIIDKLLDEEGVFKMSYGHLQGGKLVIDRGRLVGFDSHIVKYDKRNRIS